jgi:hypothetical protein
MNRSLEGDSKLFQIDLIPEKIFIGTDFNGTTLVIKITS